MIRLNEKKSIFKQGVFTQKINLKPGQYLKNFGLIVAISYFSFIYTKRSFEYFYPLEDMITIFPLGFYEELVRTFQLKNVLDLSYISSITGVYLELPTRIIFSDSYSILFYTTFLKTCLISLIIYITSVKLKFASKISIIISIIFSMSTFMFSQIMDYLNRYSSLIVFLLIILLFQEIVSMKKMELKNVTKIFFYITNLFIFSLAGIVNIANYSVVFFALFFATLFHIIENDKKKILKTFIGTLSILFFIIILILFIFKNQIFNQVNLLNFQNAYLQPYLLSSSQSWKIIYGRGFWWEDQNYLTWAPQLNNVYIQSVRIFIVIIQFVTFLVLIILLSFRVLNDKIILVISNRQNVKGIVIFFFFFLAILLTSINPNRLIEISDLLLIFREPWGKFVVFFFPMYIWVTSLSLDLISHIFAKYLKQYTNIFLVIILLLTGIISHFLFVNRYPVIGYNYLKPLTYYSPPTLKAYTNNIDVLRQSNITNRTELCFIFGNNSDAKDSLIRIYQANFQNYAYRDYSQYSCLKEDLVSLERTIICANGTTGSICNFELPTVNRSAPSELAYKINQKRGKFLYDLLISKDFSSKQAIEILRYFRSNDWISNSEVNYTLCKTRHNIEFEDLLNSLMRTKKFSRNLYIFFSGCTYDFRSDSTIRYIGKFDYESYY